MPVFRSPFAPKGRAERLGESRARGARMCKHASIPPALSAGGRWFGSSSKNDQQNRASEAGLRLRSARGWVNGLLHRPLGFTGVTVADAASSCELSHGMHLSRPLVSPAVCLLAWNPKIPGLRRRCRHGHRIPLHERRRSRAPLTGAGRADYISETAKLSIYEKQKFDHEAVSAFFVITGLVPVIPLRDALTQ